MTTELAINWVNLREHKTELKRIASDYTQNSKQGRALYGILNMINEVQKQAADDIGDDVVYGRALYSVVVGVDYTHRGVVMIRSTSLRSAEECVMNSLAEDGVDSPYFQEVQDSLERDEDSLCDPRVL